jgi:hypothetical protein
MPRSQRGLVLAGALVLAGCSVGGREAQEPTEPHAVTKAQLAAMVLPAEELGPSIKGLEVDDDSGLLNNAEAADDSIDPDDTGESLRAAGRISGHERSYVHPKLISSKGVLGVGSAVELFEDPVYAAQYLHERLNDYERFRNAVPGLKLSEHSEFEAAAIGDEAAGQRVKITAPGVATGYETDIVFRRGRIVAWVAVVRADRRDTREEALSLAAELNSRIQAVLAGEIEVEPAEPEASTEATAAELEKLPELTLAPADVGAGVAAVEQGRREDEDYHAYYRDFKDVVVGGSHLITLRGETQLYDTQAEAALAYKIATQKAGRLIFARAVIQGFTDGAGVTPTDVRAQPLPNPGRGISGMVVTFDIVEAKFKLVAVFTRSGRLVQSVLAICRESLDPKDLEALARRAQARLTA